MSHLFAATHSKFDETGQRIWCDEHAQSAYVSQLYKCTWLFAMDYISIFFT